MIGVLDRISYWYLLISCFLFVMCLLVSLGQTYLSFFIVILLQGKIIGKMRRDIIVSFCLVFWITNKYEFIFSFFFFSFAFLSSFKPFRRKFFFLLFFFYFTRRLFLHLSYLLLSWFSVAKIFFYHSRKWLPSFFSFIWEFSGFCQIERPSIFPHCFFTQTVICTQCVNETWNVWTL